MSKKIQHKVTLDIPAGLTSFSKVFTLPDGFASHVVAYSNRDQTGIEFSLSLKDDANVEIIPAINLRNWEQRQGGSYKDSFKPLNMDAMGRDYKLELSTENSGSTIKVDVYFLYNL